MNLKYWPDMASSAAQWEKRKSDMKSETRKTPSELLEKAQGMVSRNNVPAEFDDLFEVTLGTDADTYTSMFAAYLLGQKTAGLILVENEQADEELAAYADAHEANS